MSMTTKQGTLKSVNRITLDRFARIRVAYVTLVTDGGEEIETRIPTRPEDEAFGKFHDLDDVFGKVDGVALGDWLRVGWDYSRVKLEVRKFSGERTIIDFDELEKQMDTQPSIIDMQSIIESLK